MKERQGLCRVVRFGCMYEGKTRVMSWCQRLYVARSLERYTSWGSVI